MCTLRIDGVCPSGGGGTPVTNYTNLNPTPEEHGGIPAGTTFINQSMQQMFDAILYPYQAPSFNSFLIQGQAHTIEVGDSIPQNVTFQWSTLNSANMQPGSGEIRDVTGGGLLLATGLGTSGTVPVAQASAITKFAKATHTYQITGLNSLGGGFSRNDNYNWVWRRYYGSSNVPDLGVADPADIPANLINQPLADMFAGDYSFPALGSPEYKYICYAAILGTATSFIDVSTMLAVPFIPLYPITITNAFGQPTVYNVHRSTNQSAGAITIRVA